MDIQNPVRFFLCMYCKKIPVFDECLSLLLLNQVLKIETPGTSHYEEFFFCNKTNNNYNYELPVLGYQL